MEQIQLMVQTFCRSNRKFGKGVHGGFLKHWGPLYLVILQLVVFIDIRHTDGLIHCYRNTAKVYYLTTFIAVPSIMTVHKST